MEYIKSFKRGRNVIILICLLLLAFFLRVWNVTTVPPSLYWDEVSQGYNAYAILTTGYDEHHTFLPLTHFVAFGDNKAPVNIYLTVISLLLFGKTTFAIRFPSLFFGTLTILLTYFLTRELFWQHKRREILSLLTAGLLAISPWHIQLSRAAFEANIATFFTILAFVLFFVAKRKNPWLYILSVVSFVIAFYAFTAHRVFIPLIVLSLVIIWWKELFLKKKQIIVALIVGIILMLPMFFYLLNPDSRIRFTEVNIFSDPGVVQQSNTWLAEDHNSLIGKVFDNRRVGYTLLYLKHYFDFFNPQYLFFTGDVDTRFSSQYSGELWLWELPFIVIGFYIVIKMKSKITLFILLWFLLAPVAAATARETPHALRSETYIPIYEIVIAFGLLTAVLFLWKKKIILYCVATVVLLLALFEAVYFLHGYYSDFPRNYSYDWQYGYSQAIVKAQKLQNNYDSVVFTDFYGRAYMYYLWYGNIAPATYWKEGNPTADVFGLYGVTKVGKWQFRGGNIEQASDSGRNVLYVASPQQLKPDLRVIDQVNFVNGDPAFLLAVKK